MVLEGKKDHHEESSDEEAAASPHVTASEVFNALDVTLCWLEQNKCRCYSPAAGEKVA